jgi:enoyl-[acyl-carrier protein] reductase I
MRTAAPREQPIKGRGAIVELLEGHRGLVFGVANERSIAWHIAHNAIQQGATCAFSYYPDEKMERRVRRTLEAHGLTDAWIRPCDLTRDEDLDALFAALADDGWTLDFVVHSVAFADRAYLTPGTFHETPRDVFTAAMDASVYTLIAAAQRAVPLMPNGGSILSLSYYGAEKAIPGYNVMGVAKAALEATTRYLAAELGTHNIRINALSAGPCRTVSAMAIGEVDQMFASMEARAPLRRNITTDEVGKAAVYLLSALSSGVTGETHHVDAGYNAVAG